jgi:hypothetical protein
MSPFLASLGLAVALIGMAVSYILRQSYYTVRLHYN